jgi:N-acetylmuramic acid 6-phosphate etherase
MKINVTEQDSRFKNLDKMSTRELLCGINSEDKIVAYAVEKSIPQIERLVDAVAERMSRGGRLFYLGSGTSGRLGITDASEVLPTFGVDNLFLSLISGGDKAFRDAYEDAEDDPEQGWKDMQPFNPTENDSVIGISASGSAPYSVGALQTAKEHGLLTGCICCNEDSAMSKVCDYPIVAVVGPEFVTGSTRMKAGTATKLILNMISTSLMILSGHVKGCKMVDMQLTNRKLVDRGTRMLMEATGIKDYQEAKELLLASGSVRKAEEQYKNLQP